MEERAPGGGRTGQTRHGPLRPGADRVTAQPQRIRHKIGAPANDNPMPWALRLQAAAILAVLLGLLGALIYSMVV